jgi:TonB-dependent SusC/RagA subfamily outer membrane receptor
VYGYVLDYLRGRVPGVRVATDSSGAAVVSIRGGKTPLFLMDGMRVDLEFIRSIPMSEVELIEVLKGPNAAVYGSSAANGVIAFYTKRVNPDYDWSKEEAPGVLSFKLLGYNKPKEFYVPRYDVPDERHNLPDYRNTLHWQHTVTTDASGKAHITFFTSDVITEFIATCEGMSTGGIVGTAEHRFNRLSQ